MEHRRLGASGLRVSAIALGTMNFGPVIDERASFTVLDAAVEADITFVDTADVYGGPPLGTEPGQTELLLGRWMAERGCRDDLVLASKVFGQMGEGPNDRGLSAAHIVAGVDASLARLGVERLDLLQLHHIDREVPVDEVLDALSALRAQGKILYAGSSNFAGWHLAQYAERAAHRRAPRLVSEQSVYNLTQRSIELEVAAAALEYGIGLLPYSPLAGGLLGGILTKRDSARSRQHPRLEQHRTAIERHEALAREAGISPAQLAFAWLRSRPAVSSIVVGPRTVEQLRDAATGVAIELEPAVLAELDEIWPGPGQAPDAYAW
ncbi:MAG: aldo/keto reductase [Actinomycetota bacterium]